MPREPTFEEIVAGDDPVAQASIEVIEAFTADRQRLGRVRAAATEAPRAARLPLRLRLAGAGWQGPSMRTYRGTQGDAGQSLAVMRAGRASEPTPHTRRISIPRTEAHVIRHLHERMPYRLFVPDVVLE